MKKVALIMLLVLFLSVSMTVTAENLDGFTNSQETILNLTDAGSETDLYMTAVASGGVAVLSVCLSEQMVVDNIYILSVVPVNYEILLSFPISLERQISKGWSIYLAVES